MGSKKRQLISLLMFALLVPILLANKDCERSTTWGEKYFAKWESDHVDIDAETRCVDCHDDIKSPKVKPKNHDATWTRKHGDFDQRKFGFKNGNVCILCHTEEQCTQCHQIEAPQQHTEFWKQRGHAASVGLDRSKCSTCHKDTQFCEKCHSSVAPTSHNAAFGGLTNNHCFSCHFPLNSAGAKECSVCHTSTPSHDLAPQRPANALHVNSADCLSCHVLRHPNNGEQCILCH